MIEFSATVLSVIIGTLGILLLLLGAYVLSLRGQVRRQSETIRQLQEKRNSRQLELVESTLNPHLFKNILNSIQSHAFQTYFALDKLANVLDYILYDSRQSFVTVSEEIQFARNLVEINKIKLSPLFELQFKTDVDEHDDCYLQKSMAPLVTIDLIENAFKHADIQSADSFIRILVELQHGVFTMTVANKISAKPPLPKPRSGIGSKTLEQRLQLIYGDHYSIERLIEDDQYIAQLKIRLRDYKTEVHSPGRRDTGPDLSEDAV